MSGRLFTPLEANKTLPLVRRIVRDILEKGRLLRLETPEEGDGDGRLEQLQEELHEHLEELESIGCSYKDWGFEVGLIDFPAIIDGEPVLLCWRSDEESVGWYHDYEAGFAGRRPIPAHMLEVSEELPRGSRT